MKINPISFLLGIAGTLVGLGVITLSWSHAMTALVALVLMLAAATNLLAFELEFVTPRTGIPKPWVVAMAVYGLLAVITVVKCVVFLLFA